MSEIRQTLNDDKYQGHRKMYKVEDELCEESWESVIPLCDPRQNKVGYWSRENNKSKWEE